MSDRGIGLDLGTSKISVCIKNRDRVEQIQIANLQKEFPCCIYYNNKVLFGEEARMKGKSDPKYCFRNLKTLIGRLFSDEYVQYIKDYMSYSIVKGENDRVMVEVYEKDQIVLKDPTELLAMLVNFVIEDAQKHMGNKKIEYLALAFPPSFNDNQKMELKRIGILTGIRHIELYPETTAACIYYGFTSMAPEQTVMVVDCGAGTCDATILKYNNGFEVVGHAGKDTIGGARYSQELMAYVLKEFKNNDVPMKKLNKKKSYLEDVVENGKIALKTSSYVDIDIDDDYQPILVTQAKLNIISNKLNKEIVAMVKDLIESTKCQPNNIILSGKGMFLASLAKAVCDAVGLENMAMNIDEPVAHGLAMYLDEIIKNHKEDDHCNEIRVFDDTNNNLNDLNMSFPPIPEFPGPFMADQTPIPEFPGGSVPPYNEIPVDIQSSFPEMPLSGFVIPGVDSSIHHSFPIPEDAPPIDDPTSGISNPSEPAEVPIMPSVNFSLPGSLNASFPSPEEPTKPSEEENPVSNIITNHEDIHSIIDTINCEDIPELNESLITSLSPDNPIPENPNGFHITEKRAFDLSIGTASKVNTDRKVLIGRKEILPCSSSCTLRVVKGRVFQFSLYEGNSRWKKNNKRIRHTILERDNEHPDTNDHKFKITVNVDKNGFIQTSFEWDDTKKPIRVIEDKELNKHAEIHKPSVIERPVQQNNQAFTDIDTCKEAIRKMISEVKGELKKMKPKDAGVIEDDIRDIETLLPLQDSLDALNRMYLNAEDIKKKAESVLSTPTRTREMEFECYVCSKCHVKMCLLCLSTYESNP